MPRRGLEEEGSGQAAFTSSPWWVASCRARSEAGLAYTSPQTDSRGAMGGFPCGVSGGAAPHVGGRGGTAEGNTGGFAA